MFEILISDVLSIIWNIIVYRNVLRKSWWCLQWFRPYKDSSHNFSG